jgi:hypothetical protein
MKIGKGDASVNKGKRVFFPKRRGNFGRKCFLQVPLCLEQSSPPEPPSR